MNAVEPLLSASKALGIDVSAEQQKMIERLLDELRAFNEHTNLVSNADPEVVVRDHVIDSLTLMPLLRTANTEDTRIADIGAGAGFPGLILAIMLPNARVALVESVAKKTKFQTQCAQALGIADRVTVLTGRAEEFAHERRFREQFDFATARAVAKLDLVAELTLPFLKVGGRLLAQKSRQQSIDEVQAAAPAVTKLGGRVVSTDAPRAEATERDVVIVVIQKLLPTPSNLPRHSSQLKRPLK